MMERLSTFSASVLRCRVLREYQQRVYAIISDESSRMKQECRAFLEKSFTAVQLYLTAQDVIGSQFGTGKYGQIDDYYVSYLADTCRSYTGLMRACLTRIDFGKGTNLPSVPRSPLSSLEETTILSITRKTSYSDMWLQCAICLTPRYVDSMETLSIKLRKPMDNNSRLTILRLFQEASAQAR